MRGHTSISTSRPAARSFSAIRTASSRRISSLPTWIKVGAGRRHRRKAARRNDGAGWHWSRNFSEARDALGRARQLESDVVLLDSMMPKIEDVSVLRELATSGLACSPDEGLRNRGRLLQQWRDTRLQEIFRKARAGLQGFHLVCR